MSGSRPVTWRLFIAIEPPPPAVLDHLAEFTAALGFVQAEARVTARRLWHVTLAFIGDVPEDRLPAAVAALDLAATAPRSAAQRSAAQRSAAQRSAGTPAPSGPGAGPVTRPSGPGAGPVVRLAGGGRFGRGRSTILWAGVEGELAPLRRATVGALKRERLPYDDQRFHPHLTLGRPGDRVHRRTVRADLAAMSRYRGPTWTVGGLVLYRSVLGPDPVYEPLHATSLPDPAEPADPT